MKKYLLSLGLIIVFAFYALLSSNRNTTAQVAAVSSTPNSASNEPPVAVNNTTVIVKKTTPPASATPLPTPIATTVSTPAPVTTANTGKFKNGTFTGPVVDAYYGNVQVSAIIQSGQITDVKFLQYPSDRSTSIRVNTRAMPLLKSEAIQAQSASVDGVSGATATSDAFRQSLGSALATAAN